MMDCIECNGTFCAFCAHNNKVNHEENNADRGENKARISR